MSSKIIFSTSPWSAYLPEAFYVDSFCNWVINLQDFECCSYRIRKKWDSFQNTLFFGYPTTIHSSSPHTYFPHSLAALLNWTFQISCIIYEKHIRILRSCVDHLFATYVLWNVALEKVHFKRSKNKPSDTYHPASLPLSKCKGFEDEDAANIQCFRRWRCQKTKNKPNERMWTKFITSWTTHLYSETGPPCDTFIKSQGKDNSSNNMANENETFSFSETRKLATTGPPPASQPTNQLWPTVLWLTAIRLLFALRLAAPL